jgi:REP element-mobilizing transposase RayT
MSLRFRKHVRLPDHDYLNGAYFVTMCSYWRKQVFGRIIGTGADARIELTDTGRIVDECWWTIPDHFPHARLHEMQIMPDHLHAIIVLDTPINNGTVAATQWVATTDAVEPTSIAGDGPRPGSLGAIIGAFKSVTTRRVNRLNGTPGSSLWQPNYHERIIREHYGEMGRIAQYIAENPQNWR